MLGPQGAEGMVSDPDHACSRFFRLTAARVGRIPDNTTAPD